LRDEGDKKLFLPTRVVTMHCGEEISVMSAMLKSEIKSPDIRIELKRPLQNIEPPYGQCDRCHYVSTEIVSNRICPNCRCNHQGEYTHWPDPELTELWYDAIAMWNEGRVELSAVVAAMYFESSVFHLIFWGAAWLDPKLNWRGLDFDRTAKKQKEIWTFLNSIRTRERTDAALKGIFGSTSREMLVKVLGENDARHFWYNYLRLAKYRNDVVHKGRRSIIRIDGTPVRSDRNSDAILYWCIRFVPYCWCVFAKLHNEFIYKPILERKKSS
jgi:hypothetical protein